ncbi:LacI family DNA-binding transcriptional regulator [Cohnella faecalis]|nr:LacI family DNA-binding transcriptional regulator [Cohnella faecalis]
MAVTIIDVARRANVSKSTVSLVINNSPAIKLETKYKVLRAIEELGYVPNINARGLTSRKTNILGVLTMVENLSQKSYNFDSDTEIFSYDVSIGIPKGLVNTDFGLLNERFCIPENSNDLPLLIKNNRIDGLFIIGGLFGDDFAKKIKDCGIPTVVVGRKNEFFDYITADLEQGVFLSTTHLLETGHKKLCYINCPVTFSTSVDRYNGFQKAIDSSEVKPEEKWSINAEHNNGAGGYQAIKDIWEAGKRPDAILAANDSIALGIMRYLYEQKVRIPEDISMISYENSILSGYSVPALSTVDINKELIGEEACRILLNRIARPKSKRVSMVIPTTLVHRDSVIVRS